MTEPCDWTLDTTCCPEWATTDPGIQALATSWSSYILWALTGRQFGLCDITVRPCYRRCTPRSYATFGVWMESPYGSGNGWLPFVDDVGEWRNCGCCGVCCCGASCEVWLPGPVASVTSVLVDNVAVAPAAYRIDNMDLLVRQDGSCWPECNNMDVPPASTDGTFVVTYKRGKALPVAAEMAVGELACEIAKGCSGGACGIPQQVRSINRAGVSFELVNPSDIFRSGLTGLDNVDKFIRAVNPYGLAQEATVLSPDLVQPRQQTWP